MTVQNNVDLPNPNSTEVFQRNTQNYFGVDMETKSQSSGYQNNLNKNDEVVLTKVVV